MSTPNTVKAQLRNLIDIANRVTGKSDADLTGAVNTLVDERESLIDGSITEVYSEVKAISDYSFAKRQKLISVNLPNITSIPPAAFYQDGSLKNIIVPKIGFVSANAISGCVSLQNMDLNMCYSIDYYVFSGCSLLSCVVLRKTDGVCKLVNSNSFDKTKISEGTGFIYVPRASIDSYKTATNWTVYASQFRALEDYTVDGTVTGELDWDKVNGGSV